MSKRMIKKKVKIKPAILNTLKEILYNSTGQGLVKILHNQYKTVQIMWIVTLVCSSTLCFFLITNNVLNFLKFDVNTKTRKITQIPMLFPTITICNKNMFQTSYALDHIKKIILKNNLTNIFSASNQNITDDEIQEILFLSASYTLSSNFTDEMRKNLSLPLSTILRSCKYDDQPCGVEDFFWKYNRYLGNCFIFNSGINETILKETKQIGKRNGLSLTLYHNIKTELKNLYSDYGLTIRIDNSSNWNVDFVDGIDLLSGVVNNIAIEKIFVNKMRYPYSNCEVDYNDTNPKLSDLYKVFADSSHPYKEQYCLDLCYQMMAYEQCNCTDQEAISLDNDLKEVCVTVEQSRCLDKVYVEFLDKNLINECMPQCPLECHENYFKTTFSFSHFAKSDDNLLKLNIYYDELSYTLINEAASLTIFEMFSNIGGTLGLFLGISLLSFIEVVEVLFNIFFITQKT